MLWVVQVDLENMVDQDVFWHNKSLLLWKNKSILKKVQNTHLQVPDIINSSTIAKILNFFRLKGKVEKKIWMDEFSHIYDHYLLYQWKYTHLCVTCSPIKTYSWSSGLHHPIMKLSKLGQGKAQKPLLVTMDSIK